ncbi:unnamed protein product, partial [Mycena citricolor]
ERFQASLDHGLMQIRLVLQVLDPDACSCSCVSNGSAQTRMTTNSTFVVSRLDLSQHESLVRREILRSGCTHSAVAQDGRTHDHALLEFTLRDG